MSARHIHADALSLRYGAAGIPSPRPHDGYAGGGRGWVRSPLARAIADRERAEQHQDAVRAPQRVNAPQRGAGEQIRAVQPRARVHPGWGRLPTR